MGTSHDTSLPEYFPTMVRQILSTASNQTIAYIQSQYDFAGNPAKLAWDWTTDVIFACNAANIATAYKNRARRYIFSVPPAVHGQDLYCKFDPPLENTLGSCCLAIPAHSSPRPSPALDSRYVLRQSDVNPRRQGRVCKGLSEEHAELSAWEGDTVAVLRIGQADHEHHGRWFRARVPPRGPGTSMRHDQSGVVGPRQWGVIFTGGFRLLGRCGQIAICHVSCARFRRAVIVQVHSPRSSRLASSLKDEALLLYVCLLEQGVVKGPAGALSKGFLTLSRIPIHVYQALPGVKLPDGDDLGRDGYGSQRLGKKRELHFLGCLWMRKMQKKRIGRGRTALSPRLISNHG